MGAERVHTSENTLKRVDPLKIVLHRFTSVALMSTTTFMLTLTTRRKNSVTRAKRAPSHGRARVKLWEPAGLCGWQILLSVFSTVLHVNGYDRRTETRRDVLHPLWRKFLRGGKTNLHVREGKSKARAASSTTPFLAPTSISSFSNVPSNWLQWCSSELHWHCLTLHVDQAATAARHRRVAVAAAPASRGITDDVFNSTLV